MRRRFVGFVLAAIFASGVGAAPAYRPDFDPSHLKGPRAGPPTQVVVLGTAHLSGLPAAFRPEALQPLIARLAAWQPAAIAVEAVSGPQCDFMRHYPDRYRDSVDGFCWDPAPAREATGLDVPAATQEAERLLAHWPAAPTPGQRRHLAALFLAAGEQGSAMVQWLRLPAEERHAGEGLNDVLVARLIKLQSRHDETLLIAAPLAARLGLERLYAMDDHTADAVVADEAAYGAAIERAWKNPALDRRKAIDSALEAKTDTPDGVLALYRADNVPGMARLVFDSDFGAALNEPSPQRFGRGYVAYWETRNLRMAANIRDMLQFRPGRRALVIVGAAHKGYLEAYLNQMHDVQIEDVETILK